MNRIHPSLGLALLLAACAPTDDPVDTDTDADTDAMVACEAPVIEADFNPDPTLDDPSVWGPFPDTAIVSTTYLRLNPDGMEEFGAAMGPIVGDLMQREGLLGLSLGDAMGCGVARTLTVWESEEAMMGFVLGEAHMNAIAAVANISRGGSITDHWDRAELGDVTWEAVTAELVNHDGPVY